MNRLLLRKFNKIFWKNYIFKNMKESAKFEDVLPNAVKGNVVTRFPPEPSGYLHIGHIKAAMLNYHYAKIYEGKMILRFDDTNPANEKDEYVQNIIQDLEKLEIIPDQITHTSDYFDLLQDYMTKLISEGKCYVDNTYVDKMREERNAGIASKNRDLTIEENLKIWNEMLGSNPSDDIKKYCVRGKIDFTNTNKCLRDPVFYRFNNIPHHRLGDKYKIYPTYDFACPVVDSHEGVTHCLRTNEYSARIPMYKWVLEALKLRDVIVYEFSRLCLIHTVLSKRNLKWFVNNNMVDGWYDPRFPTVQGVLRRGITVKTLKDFMLAQGPSKNTNLMEWDKLWAINRDNIDGFAKRLFAVSVENGVELNIEDKSDVPEKIEVDWHPKDKTIGTRTQFRANKLLIEYDDAKEIVEGQKLTLYKWGNSLVTKVEKEGDVIKTITVKLTPEDLNFKKTKVVHWVPLAENTNAKVLLVEFDHLITVKKIEEDNKIEDVVNTKSRFETVALAEIEILNLKKGDFVQLERRGYYYVDKDTSEGMMTLHFIPDGKSKAVSVVSMKVDAKKIAKGEDEGEGKKKKEKKKEENKKENKEKKENKPVETKIEETNTEENKN